MPCFNLKILVLNSFSLWNTKPLDDADIGVGINVVIENPFDHLLYYIVFYSSRQAIHHSSLLYTLFHTSPCQTQPNPVIPSFRLNINISSPS